eukprot:CAMPEP_0201586604 /NCGR_PEP_ID=MMETSP0190_2-20130828/134347_1 /ASSEMBLY_ACC=CAM_ASM_000263 /TAXON_ID=37353 /ORGANISM="Rosalina sp." /LENGTH=46 /DNA_ID= /DNA_START= /DNA_END= /DNA_ORIENTATION=
MTQFNANHTEPIAEDSKRSLIESVAKHTTMLQKDDDNVDTLLMKEN